MDASFHKTAWAFVLAGSVNVGLQGLGGFLNVNLDIFHSLLGYIPEMEYMIYCLIGIFAIMLAMHPCESCSK